MEICITKDNSYNIKLIENQISREEDSFSRSAGVGVKVEYSEK